MYILASDYDGTLRRGEGISDADRAAISAFRKAGNRFGIVTGRGHSGFVRELHRVDFSDYDFLICNNGAVLYDGDHLIRRHYCPGEVLDTLIPFIISVGGLYAAITVDQTHFLAIYGQNSGGIEGDGSGEEDFIHVHHLDRIRQFNQVDCNIGNETDAAEFAAQVNLRYGKWLAAFHNGTCVDIVPAGVSKPAGLREYLAFIGAKEGGRVLSVGDNFNDLGMLLEFDGYAIASGRPEIVERVGRSCSDIAELIGTLAK
ncbi:MAG: HAD hydrolase family protein [Candidatus Howiella sp.]|jgi:hydroxymethylpyrimidine pyrophosphatase-like HAD family hydrolase